MNSYLDIPKPCHEDWSEMLPAEKGRFCHSCKKEVRDLTQYSYSEMLDQFRQSGGEMCGRVNVQELRKGYVDQRLRQLRAEQVRNFFLAALLSFGVSLFSITKASAVNALKEIRASFAQVQEDTLSIRGIVTDKESKEKLPFTVIGLYSGDTLITTVSSNMEGEFKLEMPMNNNIANLKLKVTYLGYHPVEIQGLKANQKMVFDIKMEPAELDVSIGIIIDTWPENSHKLDGSGRTIKREDIRRMPK